ncbi:MAG: DNA repair protein RecO [Pyrinomonadaceae bacterium]|nr:DNA repair protein RecO [Pyrinomonadaceae bacterium]
MKLVETDAIVIRSYIVAESDKIIVFFTRQNGLVSLVVKGARRLKNRFGGRLEPFTALKIVYLQKEETELGYLQEAEIEESLFPLFVQPEVLSALSHFGELVMVAIGTQDANPVLYRMLLACLLEIKKSNPNTQDLKWLVCYFELWLLKLTGYLPDLRICMKCRRSDAEVSGWYWNDGTPVCERCTIYNASRLTSEQRFIWGRILKTSPNEFLQFASSRELDQKDFIKLIKSLTRRVFERESVYWSNAA